MINLSKVDFNYSEYIKIMNKNHFSGWLIILVFIVTLVPIKVIADEFERATGFIIQRNFSAAIKELEPLAKQGNEKAQIRLAIYYTKREIYDSALAKYWITQAANRDNADAQEMLGTFLMCTSFVWRDNECYSNFSEGKKWLLLAFQQYQKQAQNGNCRGYERLANFYFFGQIIPRDIMKGLASLKSASICGDVEAPRRLALLYTSDNAPPFRGVPRDYTKGYAWSIIVSAKNYDYENAALRENIEKQLLPEQIRLGQQIARECLETNYQRCIL